MIGSVRLRRGVLIPVALALMAWSAETAGADVTPETGEPGQPTAARSEQLDSGVEAATGTVSGTILWTDAEGNQHPVRGALVQFYVTATAPSLSRRPAAVAGRATSGRSSS